MSFDLARMHGWIVEEYQANREPSVSMERVIDECASHFPRSDWVRLRKLPFGDLSALQAWILKPLQKSPPPEPLRGLWFGMFNPCYDDEPVADIYVCGSKRFDPDPYNMEWATGPNWWPDDRYAHSDVMAMIYRIAYEVGGLGNDAEYPLCLAYGAFAIRGVLNSLAPSQIPVTIESVGVAVGFDSGDGLLLGRLTRHGLAPL